MKLDFDTVSEDQLTKLILEHMTFELTGLSGRVKETAVTVEKIIEKNGLRCRVYVYGRVAAAGGTLFGGVTAAIGLAAAAGIGVHNLATLNPDYEIAKHLVDNMLTVKYCK